MLILLLVTCLVSLAHCDRLEELEELLVAEYDNFTLLCNSTHNSTDNAGFLGGFSKLPLSLSLFLLGVTRYNIFVCCSLQYNSHLGLGDWRQDLLHSGHSVSISIE